MVTAGQGLLRIGGILMNKKLYELHQLYSKHDLQPTGVKLAFHGLGDRLLICSCGMCAVQNAKSIPWGSKEDIARIAAGRYHRDLLAACTPRLRAKVAAYRKFRAMGAL